MTSPILDLHKLPWYFASMKWIAFCLIAGLAAGCSSSHEITPEQFQRMAAGVCTPMATSQYAGRDETRAYVRAWRMSPVWGSHTTTYWVPLEKLPPAYRAQLRREADPWLPATRPTTAPSDPRMELHL